MKHEQTQAINSSILDELKPMELPPLPENPLVSVLIANYNYGQYIGEAIESVLNQTYQNFEIIICDDGSTDNSLEVIKKYAERDSRVKYIAKENGGVASALNSAFLESKGEVISLLDADDVYLKDRLLIVVNDFSHNQNIGMVVHRLVPVNAGLKILGEPVPKKMDSGWYPTKILSGGGFSSLPPASGLSWRREVAEAIFPAPNELRRGVDGYLRVAAALNTVVLSEEKALALYRLHGNNVTGFADIDCERLEKFVTDLMAINRALVDYIGYRWKVNINLDIERSRLFWVYLAALYIVSGKPKEGVLGYHKCDLLDIYWKKLDVHRLRYPWLLWWSLIKLIPHPASKFILGLWWSNNRMKQLYRRLRQLFSLSLQVQTNL
ncbi:glycosyltransferase [Rhodothermus marinus]|uniref:glycosyltransferase n=1 Tax=Rhodothermus marinus TaxID=29549 RepID=UPI0012BA39AD|nr:glycosyltransferase [Rhodothermus marinus]BBM69079.1 hypothetical protein RmaAA213_09250 [Rhodothermus marinus]